MDELFVLKYRDQTDYNKLRLYVKNIYICFIKNQSIYEVVYLAWFKDYIL